MPPPFFIRKVLALPIGFAGDLGAWGATLLSLWFPRGWKVLALPIGFAGDLGAWGATPSSIRFPCG